MTDPIRRVDPKPTAFSAPARRVGRHRKDDRRPFEDALGDRDERDEAEPEPEPERAPARPPAEDGEPGSNLDLTG